MDSTIVADLMPHIYRISRGLNVGDIVDSVESLEAFARDNGRGCFHVDEHAADFLPGSKSSARAWGNVIDHNDGQVVPEPHSWDER
jgi:hypothetical protein